MRHFLNVLLVPVYTCSCACTRHCLTFSLQCTTSILTGMMPEGCEEEESSLPAQKKLKQSDEKVDLYKIFMHACMYTYMHSACQIAYTYMASFLA